MEATIAALNTMTKFKKKTHCNARKSQKSFLDIVDEETIPILTVFKVEFCNLTKNRDYPLVSLSNDKSYFLANIKCTCN